MFARLIMIVGLLAAGHIAQAEGNRAPITMAEDSHEASTALVSLPASNAGTLLFKNCSECNRNPLKLNATSRYFLRGREVSFEVFKTTYNMADQQFTVYFKPNTHIVTRIKLNPVTARTPSAH